MFKKAEKKQAKLKIAMAGPSGHGKTFSALRLARGIVGPEGRIALIDTENGSASLYSDRFDFDVTEIGPPFTTEKYNAAMLAAERAGYDILITDSASHLWNSTGGLLEQKDALDLTSKNKHTNWNSISKKHESWKTNMLQSPMHMIVTMRSKQHYEQVEEEGNKKKIVKMGMAPIQRDNMEYEFTLWFDLHENHSATASKDRTSLFRGRPIIELTEQIGEELLAWHQSGKEVHAPLPGDYVFTINNKEVRGKTLHEVSEAEPERFKKLFAHLDSLKSRTPVQEADFQAMITFSDYVAMSESDHGAEGPSEAVE